MSERPTRAGASHVTAADGHPVRQRAGQHAEQFLVTGRPADHENLRFLTPVYPGDELTVTLTCQQITPREDAGHGEVRWDVSVANQDGKPVASYELLTLVAKEWTPA